MNIGIIIQARMGSTRLPGKVLKKIGDKTLLQHIFCRLQRLQAPASIVLATSILAADDILEVFCQENKITCFRGSELEVLERYYFCAKKFDFDHIVRLTGDNPFVDIDEIDNLIRLHLTEKADYSRSFGCLPKGVGSEIFTFDALLDSHLHGHKENHREHVNEYIEEQEDKFFIAELQTGVEKNQPQINLTVDTETDYNKACYIVENSVQQYISTKEAIRLCLEFA